jgi:hypothetical protein
LTLGQFGHQSIEVKLVDQKWVDKLF